MRGHMSQHLALPVAEVVMEQPVEVMSWRRREASTSYFYWRLLPCSHQVLLESEPKGNYKYDADSLWVKLAVRLKPN